MFKKLFDNINNELQKAFKGEHITQQCKNCGAMVEGSTRDEVITCQYCGMSQKNNFYKPLVDLSSTQGANVDNDDFDVEVNRRPGPLPRFRHGHSYAPEVYAWVTKGGLFFEGDIPGLNFCRVSLCDSFEECVAKLRHKYREQLNSSLYEPPKQNIDEIRRQKPNARIIRID